LISLWHSCAIEQDRDHRDIPLQCRPDLDAQEIRRVIQTTVALFVSDIQPVGPNQRQQHVTLGDLVSQDLGEVHPERDGVHVDEQEVRSELWLQPVVNAPGGMAGVVAAIADEHFARHGRGLEHTPFAVARHQGTGTGFAKADKMGQR
jgi:hypothetical protein